MIRAITVAVCMAVSLAASPSMAWHEVGHMLTVLIAIKQLSPGSEPSSAVKRWVEVLKHHPRFQEDIAGSMPKGLDENGQVRWLLCRASIWPDQIRSNRLNPPTFPPEPSKQGSYGRGNWHYIDNTLVIVPKGTSAAETKALEDKGRALQALGTDVPDDESRVKNVIQAIGFNRQRLLHGKPEEQAVALCWLLHTIGDIHQPLHATTAFSFHALDPASFPGGDRGGNLIHLDGGGNLHSLWDAAPDAAPDPKFDPDEPFDSRYDRAYARALKQFDVLRADAEVNARGRKAAEEEDPMRWARESYDLACSDVYSVEVREKVLAADQSAEQSAEGPVIQVSDAYRARAHTIGKLRVVQGGYRLAAFLDGVK